MPLLQSLIITKAIEANLPNLTLLFAKEVQHIHVIADIIDILNIPYPNKAYKPPIQVVLNLTQSTVNYFFLCCKDEGKFY